MPVQSFSKLTHLLVSLLVVNLVSEDSFGAAEFADDVSLVAGEVLERVPGQHEQREEAADEEEGPECDRPLDRQRVCKKYSRIH